MISIIIPTYNRRECLKACLISILRQDFSDCEIVVVDNGPSTDGADAVVAELRRNDERIRYVRTTAKGCIRARNIGAALARGDIVLMLDDDVELLRADALFHVAETFAADDSIGIVGSVELDAPDAPLQEPSAGVTAGVGRITRRGEIDTSFQDLLGRGICEVDHCRSAFLAVRKDVLDRAGRFDESFDARGMGFRCETDFCLRVKELAAGSLSTARSWYGTSARRGPAGFDGEGIRLSGLHAQESHVLHAPPRVLPWQQHSGDNCARDPGGAW